MVQKWITVLLILHASLVFCDAQICDGIADNFTTPVNIGGAVESNLTVLPTSAGSVFFFREWIFPNSLKFPCSGLLTGWMFRANNSSNLTETMYFPLWMVYTKSTGTSKVSFVLKGSGSPNTLSKIADGVYQYSLQSPLEVKEGDIVGVQFPSFPTLTNSLLLSFTGGRSGADAVSYRRPFTGKLFIIADDAGELSSFVSNDTHYTPLVTAFMNVSGPSLSVFSLTPSPTGMVEATTTPLQPRSGITEAAATQFQPRTGITEATSTIGFARHDITEDTTALFDLGSGALIAVLGSAATALVLIFLIVLITLVRKATNQIKSEQKNNDRTDTISSNEAYINNSHVPEDDFHEYDVPTLDPTLCTGSQDVYSVRE